MGNNAVKNDQIKLSTGCVHRMLGSRTELYRTTLIYCQQSKPEQVTGSVKGFHTVGDFGIDSLDIV